MRKETTPYLVLGAGPAGLSAAYELAKAGQKVMIIDKNKVCGGLMRNVNRGDYSVDFGRKELYSRIEEVNDLWSNLLGTAYKAYDYRIGILYHGHVFEKTSSYKGIRRGMPWGLFFSCGVDYLFSAINPVKPRTYQAFMYKTRGRKFSQIFVKYFSEKFNRYDWKNMAVPTTSGEGEKRISKVGDFLKRSLKDSTDAQKDQEVWRHPDKGAGQITDLLEQFIREKGAEFVLGANIKEIRTEKNRVTAVVIEKEGEMIEIIPQQVISTLPLEVTAQLMGLSTIKEATNSVSFSRGTILVYLFLDEAPRFPHTWLNVASPELRIGRITNYANMGGSMVPKGKTCLCIEFFCMSNDALFQQETEEIKDLAIEEAMTGKLFDPNKIADYMVMKFPHADAAVDWEDYLKDPLRNELFNKIKVFENLLNASRPGTDRATHAGLVAGRCSMSTNKDQFERLTDPRKAEPWLDEAAIDISSISLQSNYF
ncbi:MAG: FAD-dependent oxidoreductase [Saprospiraceae bacterium]